MDIWKYKHVIWDWNGTLLDDVFFSVQSINRVLERRGMPTITPEHHRQVFDFPVIDYYRRLGFTFEAEPFEIPAQEFITEYLSVRFDCNLRHDARSVLGTLEAHGVGQSVLSAMQHEALCEHVGHFGLDAHFEALVGIHDHYAESKTEAGRNWIEQAGVDRSRTVLIGDTRHDHEVAVALGVECVLIEGGHQDRARLESCGCPVFSSMSALLGTRGSS